MPLTVHVHGVILLAWPGRCTIGNLLDELVPRYMEPILASSGFKRIRRHRWAITSPGGHVVLVRVRPYDMGERFGFHVEWAAIPAALRDFYSEQEGSRGSGSLRFEWGIVNARLVVPEDLRMGPEFNNLWWFFPDKLDEFGARFQNLLAHDAIPTWKSALVPANALKLLEEDHELRHLNRPLIANPLYVQIIVHIDDGDPGDVERMITEADQRFPSDLLGWLHQRLRARASR